MGKVTILQSLGGGYYKIKVHFDNARVAARLSLIENTLPKLEGKLTEISGRKAEQKILIDQALQALNQYVYSTPAQVYVQDPGALNRLSASAYAERGKMEVITREERLVALRIRELEQEKKKLTAQCPDDFEAHAWCVAHNEDLSGQTASIECDYNLERDIHTNQIRNESGIWLPAEIAPPDSALQHSLSTSAWAAWFNLCVMPAAQRHKARYRIAVINGLDKEANTCNLTFQGRYDVSRDSSRLLDDAPIHPQFSEAQQMSVSDVPIEYMTSDAATFEVGDKVIVDCHTGVGTPTVIGYYEYPRVAKEAAFEFVAWEDNQPMHWVDNGRDVQDFIGFGLDKDMVENADKYTISFGTGTATGPQDPNGVWDNTFTVQWSDEEQQENGRDASFFYLTRTTAVFSFTGGRTVTDYNYYRITGQENTKKYCEFGLWLTNCNDLRIYKDGVLKCHLTSTPRGTSDETIVPFDIHQEGTPLFSELELSPEKGYFKFTGAYEADYTV